MAATPEVGNDDFALDRVPLSARYSWRSSPKERGRSRVSAGPYSWPSTSLLARRCRRRGQGSGGARPRSGRRALTTTPFGASCVVVEGRAEPPPRGAFEVVDVARISDGAWPWGAGRFGCSVIPSPRCRPSRSWPGGMMGCASPVGRGQSVCVDRAVDGGHDLRDLATDRESVGAAHADSGDGCCSARTWPSRSA